MPAGQTGPLAPSVGAIAYDPAARAAGQANGITTTTADQWRRATAQAALGLVWDAQRPATVQVTGPTKFVKGGDTAKVDDHRCGGRRAGLRHRLRTAVRGADRHRLRR